MDFSDTAQAQSPQNDRKKLLESAVSTVAALRCPSARSTPAKATTVVNSACHDQL